MMLPLVIAALTQSADPKPPAVNLAPPAIFVSNVEEQVDYPLQGDNGDTLAFSKSGNWHIRVDTTLNGGCYATAFYPKGTTLRFGHNPTTGDQVVALGSSWWRSLKSGEERPIQIAFDQVEPWVGVATAATTKAHYMLFLTVSDSRFFKEAQEARFLTAKTAKGKMLARLEMKGFSRAMFAVATCQSTINDAMDPFVESEEKPKAGI